MLSTRAVGLGPALRQAALRPRNGVHAPRAVLDMCSRSPYSRSPQRRRPAVGTRPYMLFVYCLTTFFSLQLYPD